MPCLNFSHPVSSLCFFFSGVLYLQYGDDTKQIRMPNEITSVDTIRALFVSAFSHQLNMKMLESPSTAIYVKDETRNVYYELTDVRWVCVHELHPPYSFNSLLSSFLIPHGLLPLALWHHLTWDVTFFEVQVHLYFLFNCFFLENQLSNWISHAFVLQEMCSC